MFKIDSIGATVENQFTEGNPQNGIPATVVSAEWLNMLQAELENVLISRGISLIKSDNAQLSRLLNTEFCKGKNYIDNGGMQIYQRAMPYTLIKDVYGFAVDRWAGMTTGTAVNSGTLTQTTISTLNNTGYAAKFSGVTATGNAISYFRQRMAKQDAINLKNKTIPIQFMVKHDVGADVNYTIYVKKANAADNFTTTTEIGNSGAIAVPTGQNTKIKYENAALGDCSNGLEIELKIDHGAITAKNFEIANCNLEDSIECTNFINEKYSTELLNCKRYYIQHDDAIQWRKLSPPDITLGCYQFAVNYMFPVEMVRTPTIHLYNGNFVIDTVYVCGSSATMAVTNYSANKRIFNDFSVSGTSGDTFARSHKMTIDAEL